MSTRWTARADVVVVGLGITGGPVVERLLDSSRARHIQVLDRGAVWDPAGPHYPSEREVALRSPLSVAPADDFVLFEEPGRPPVRLAKWWSARSAGGGSLLWYGQLSRFHPVDLRMRDTYGPVAGAELRDWPLDFAALERGYAAVEDKLRPFGSSYGHTPAAYAALEGPGYRDRGRPSHFERLVLDRLRADGLHPYVGRSCLGGRAWDLHPVSPLTNQVQSAGRPLLARPNWYTRLYGRLHADPRVEFTGGAYVVRVLVDGGRVTGVEYLERDDRGELHSRRLRAATVVLACGPLETCRILLTSDLENRDGLLGRRFTCTLERVGYLLTDEPRSPDRGDQLAGLHGTVVVKDFYELPDQGPVRKGGKFALYDGYVAEAPARHVKNLRLTGPALAEFLSAERERYAVKVSFKGESLPSPDKRLTLSGQRNSLGVRVPLLRYRPHRLDLGLQRVLPQLFGRLAQALGARRVLLNPAPTGSDLVSAHHHGGATFGVDPRDSVLDPDCECHEARGLFVADASSMPTSGATNSSLTAMAGADRVGAVVAARL